MEIIYIKARSVDFASSLALQTAAFCADGVTQQIDHKFIYFVLSAGWNRVCIFHARVFEFLNRSTRRQLLF